MTMAATADRFAGAWTWTRTNAPKAAVEIGVNFALPYAIYSLAHDRLGDVGALIASSAPPLAWGVAEFVRRRRIDALSLLALTGIVLSIVAFIGGGGVRFLQLRERLVTAMIGMVFLGSALIGKPLIYQLAKARLRRGGAAAQLGVLKSLEDGPQFRRVMMTATVAWGVALVGEFGRLRRHGLHALDQGVHDRQLDPRLLGAGRNDGLDLLVHAPPHHRSSPSRRWPRRRARARTCRNLS